MPRVKRQPARRQAQTPQQQPDKPKPSFSDGPSTAVDIQDEFDRWCGVKVAHDFINDMQVAKMLLDW